MSNQIQEQKLKLNFREFLVLIIPMMNSIFELEWIVKRASIHLNRSISFRKKVIDFRGMIQKLVKSGHISFNGNRIILSEKGHGMLDFILLRFENDPVFIQKLNELNVNMDCYY